MADAVLLKKDEVVYMGNQYALWDSAFCINVIPLHEQSVMISSEFLGVYWLSFISMHPFIQTFYLRH